MGIFLPIIVIAAIIEGFDMFLKPVLIVYGCILLALALAAIVIWTIVFFQTHR